MQHFKVEVTDAALEDMAEIYRYVHDGLCSPQAAARLYDKIVSAIEGLAVLPLRHPVMTPPFAQALGLRRLNVDRYAVFYMVAEASSVVAVIRVLYASMDIDARLSEEAAL